MWGTTSDISFNFKYTDPSTRKVTWDRSTSAKRWD